MTVDRRALVAQLAAAQPEAVDPEPLSLAAHVRGWLADGAVDRDALDGLCRQIDVRKRIAAGYATGWKRAEPERDARPVTVAGLVATLLDAAAGIDAPTDGGVNDGRSIKLVNSALKALDLEGELPHGPELRAWAFELLDRMHAVAR